MKAMIRCRRMNPICAVCKGMGAVATAAGLEPCSDCSADVSIGVPKADIHKAIVEYVKPTAETLAKIRDRMEAQHNQILKRIEAIEERLGDNQLSCG